MKRIGILGGTFNPIHIGHLAIAQMAQERFNLNQTIFVPSYLPPHKNIANLASAEDRYQMVHIAIRDNPLFAISDFEVHKKDKSYSVDTTRHFYRLHHARGTKLYFIIGEDSLPGLETWKDINDIVRMVTFIVVNRPGYQGHPARIKRMKSVSVVMPGIDISSSYLRKRVQQGKTIKYLVPDKVIEYIEKQKLYLTRQ